MREMIFQQLKLKGWQQFEAVDITFHNRLTVLTGANGSGKTTLLKFLANHFGWQLVHLRTPYQEPHRGWRYYINLVRELIEHEKSSKKPIEVGSITYSEGRSTPIRIPEASNEVSYNPTIDNPQKVRGLFVPSHRQEFRYDRVDALPLRARAWASEGFSAVHNAIRDRTQGAGGRPASFHIKEVLIGLAIFGYGNAVVNADLSAKELYESFQRILKKLLPPDLGFESLAIRDRAEVVLVTRSGDFLLDAVSGGVGALIELAWQIFMFSSQDSSPFVVVIDEPENHLHASMQRQLLPSLVAAFPAAQIIVSTHSPLIVGSERESNVFVLRFNEEHRVISEQLNLADKAGNAEQMLREVLDVDITIPVWAERSLHEIVQKYTKEELTPETAGQFREEMVQAGLTRWISGALIRIAEDKK